MWARGFFRMPRETESPVEFVQNRLWVLIQRSQHHQAVKPEVGGFVDQVAGVTAGCSILCRQYGFDRLFADLFENLVESLMVEAGHIGAICRGAFAGFQYLG